MNEPADVHDQQVHSDEATSGQPRFESLDLILLGTLIPIFLACFGLHVHAVLTDTLLYHAHYVSPAPSATEAPTVEGFILEFENPGDLQVGDRILRIGDVDTLGANAFQISALTHAQASDGPVLMEIERDGIRQRVTLSTVQPEVPWYRIPFVLGFAIVAVVVLLRSPGSGPTRLMFVAFISLAIFQSFFTGTSALLLYAGIFTFHVGGVLAIATLAFWSIHFPPRLDPRDRIRWGWAIPPAILWLLPRTTQYLGGPLPLSSVSTQQIIADIVLFAWVLGVLSWNYQHADPVGRRQIKWGVLGAYLGMLPYIFMGVIVALNPDIEGLRTVHALGVGFVVLVPAGFLIAIARYNLFDIDRLISGTASYTLMLILLALAGETLLEPLAGFMGQRLGFDPTSTQIVFVGMMAGAMLPIQRAWRPYVDRLFFSDGRSRTEEVELLLEELPGMAEGSAESVVDLVGARLETIFGTAFWVVYQRLNDEFHPVFAGGGVHAQPLSGESAQIISRVLDKRIRPLVLDSRGRSGEDPVIAPGLSESLQGHAPALLIPLRPQGALDAFLCIGPKLSRDVYSPTDLSLLASVAHHTSQALSAGGS